jgi:Co/Zn/Cd efflux system component
VVFATVLVGVTGTKWPDLVVAFVISGLFLHSAWNIIPDVWRELAVSA